MDFEFCESVKILGPDIENIIKGYLQSIMDFELWDKKMWNNHATIRDLLFIGRHASIPMTTFTIPYNLMEECEFYMVKSCWNIGYGMIERITYRHLLDWRDEMGTDLSVWWDSDWETGFDFEGAQPVLYR